MPVSLTAVPTMCAASDAQVETVLREARDMFRSALACWVSDLLTLQRRGSDVPTWTGSHGRSRHALLRAA